MCSCIISPQLLPTIVAFNRAELLAPTSLSSSILRDSSIVIDISRDIIVNVEEIDDETLEEEEEEVPELDSAVNVCFKVFWPSNYSYFCQDNLLPILICTQESTFRSC